MKGLLAITLLALTFITGIEPASAQHNVRFETEENWGVRQIRVNGEPLLTGCGFGFIGSATGTDDSGNITSCRSNNGGVMRPFNGNSSPSLPFRLLFRLDDRDPTKLHFGGEIGPSQFSFATVSMPMDAIRGRFTHFRHNGSSYITGQGRTRINSSTGRYDQNRFSYSHPKGPVNIAEAEGNQSWGEIIASDYTIRVAVTDRTRNMGLFFVDHPDTRNVEFSFGRVNAGERANVRGYIQVLRTDPSVLGQQPLNLTYESEQLSFHQIGRRDGDGWSVNVRDTPGRYMTYGPYTTAVPSGNRTATFRLLLDNVTADNNLILTIDVFDATTGNVLTRRDIRRRDFARASSYQDFSLNFLAPAGHQLEFRTFWHGSSYVRQDKVKIR